jgi:hypothetical protein
MDRVSRTIESHPGLSKTAVARVTSGKRQDVLAAISQLCTEGYVQTTPGERAPVLTSIRPYRCDPTEEPFGEPAENRFSPTGGEPVENRGDSGQIVSAGPPKDGEVRFTADANGGEAAPLRQPRCKVCKRPALLQKVNTMLASGYTNAAILDAIASMNLKLPPKSRITDDSLRRHQRRHFAIQAGASSLWRRLMEERAEAEATTFNDGVISLVTPRVYLEVMVAKAFGGLTDDAAEVTIDQGLAASRELNRFVTHDDDAAKWAQIHATQAKIIDAFRSLPPAYQQQVLDTVEGRTPPPPGGARLALVESGPVTGDDAEELDPEFDSLDGDEDDVD